MKNETRSVAIEELGGSQLKACLILVSESRKYLKAKCVDKNVVAKIGHNEYKMFS